jgi:hypothetical protein
MGSALFVMVVVMVFVLAWYKAEGLTFGQESHIRARQISSQTPGAEAGPKKQKRGRKKRKPEIGKSDQEGTQL